jgi:hypothetical protein
MFGEALYLQIVREQLEKMTGEGQQTTNSKSKPVDERMKMMDGRSKGSDSLEE